MAYSSDVLRRARKTLETRKMEYESLQQARQEEIYTRLPQVREIDKELQSSMAQAALAAFLNGSEGEYLFAQARQKNAELQKQREELILSVFPAEYLQDGPICPNCGGAGYIGTKMCRCLEDLCREAQKEEISQLSCGDHCFGDFRLDYYSDRKDMNLGASPRAIMTYTLEICRKYAKNFSKNSGNLLFNGGTGLGKTLLSACIAREVTEQGGSVAYESAPYLFAKLEKDHFRPDETSGQAVAKFYDCDLLIIDDLGTEMAGSFVTSALYTLVNTRLMEKKPMIISTNLNISEIKERYSPQIASRLQGGFELLPFVGEDIRVMKNK
ncbi:MAG: ATP-binding protein [Oscillospiraceae bacterium]|nr:ATP-binding protein [Oscillospiraceae bacterium]